MVNVLFQCGLVCLVLLVMPISNLAQDRENKTPPTASFEGMELTIFARFHAGEGKEEAVAAELRDAVARVSKESGCLGIEVYRSVRDSRLFFLHSRWVDEAAFDKHVERPETNQFVDRVQPLIDHPFDVTRTHLLR
jgi:quinol monooxygenase YgiN